ncbi:MAG: sulfotransferase domain-containing protein [Candidatus Promineifilaceae bacterium]
MGNIYWLASYPKSGNTWMRILLANYLWAKDKPLDINQAIGGWIASDRQAFDNHVGIEASDLLPHEIERYRPRVYDFISAKVKEPLFLKIHDAFTYSTQGHPVISKAATGGVIYLMRNPLDVAVSFAHHSRTSVKRITEVMGDPTFTFLNNPSAISVQLPQRLLTWSGHVNSWVTESGLRVLVVRYEDMKVDPIANFTRVINFCGFDADPARVEMAVEFARFERLQAHEAEHGFVEKVSATATFFRRGVTGGWRDELTPDLVDRIVTEHRSVMQHHGYLTADGELVY